MYKNSKLKCSALVVLWSTYAREVCWLASVSVVPRWQVAGCCALLIRNNDSWNFNAKSTKKSTIDPVPSMNICPLSIDEPRYVTF
ncbi:hypothetical protein BDZ97DRAFT_1840534 [Flammula alnicola]|nr:hypothetical protein BDZ97DRAFT_1840534 [Flammula alnicola]